MHIEAIIKKLSNQYQHSYFVRDCLERVFVYGYKKGHNDAIASTKADIYAKNMQETKELADELGCIVDDGGRLVKVIENKD